MFWVISVYFNIRNTLPKFCPFLLGHPVDYIHASDSIKGNKILDSLTQYKIPSKLIRLIKLTLENTTAKVKVNNVYTMEFRVESEAKQGDPLSPTLFSLVTDTVLKKTRSER